ncbi:aminoglycoside phosphotransferase family protein [Actinomadura spongiicola]|uniref:Aminoglycoside phosphotransferase family protein n=1 Tax=Actinomadura spongiicola TaxID=2303421 RepID=A0A372G7B9_9ACTN|nr:phosphotransferase [Actinomadura spongiicola]RFS81049.1 aminoglycoside phosphotransferase family protein [Actinomadura spongiicola]
MDEELLPGGRHVGGVRVGDTVHRPANPWTRTVHAVLRHLEAAGFDGAPRVLGFDDQGREVLTFLRGDTIGERHPWPPWPHSDTALRQVAAWMRRLHDITAAFVPPGDATWFAGTWRPGLVIGHHDASPYNAVWRDDDLVGFVDWDTAAPSTREFDLAHLALTWVPLHARHVAEFQGFTAFEDRSRRLHLLLDAYGHDGDRGAFADVIVDRALRQAAIIRRMVADGRTSLQPFAEQLEQAADEIRALPTSFWRA